MQNKEFESLQDGANSQSLNKESPSNGNEKKASEIDKNVEVDKLYCQEQDQQEKLR